MTTSAPLDGIKVLDLTKLAPGPLCTMILGDLGAEIIRVQEFGPLRGRRAEQGGAALAASGGGPQASSVPTDALGRNKRSIGINLKHPSGREIFLRLADESDVVVEEFRPGVAQRLGIDYPTLAARNPRLIYCAITGYGQTGPYRDLVGHDINYIATAGVLSVIGRKDQPPTVPLNLIADYAGGGMHAAIGVLAALLARTHTGRGQFVDAAMLDGSMLVIADLLSNYFSTGKVPRRGESGAAGARPFYNFYETSDGRFITIASGEPWFYANLCRALGCEEYMTDQRHPERYAEMSRRFAQIFKTKTRDQWFSLLSQTDICVGRMLTLDELEHDPQIKARNMIVEVTAPSGEKVKQIGLSLKLSDTPGAIRSLAPALGQHTGEIVAALGFSEQELARWRAEGALA